MKGDRAVESAAERLERVSPEDATFLRRLKPSLIRARIRGRGAAAEPPRAPNGPQLEPRSAGGTSPVAVAAGAAAVGALLAKLIDWRSHAHPRR